MGRLSGDASEACGGAEHNDGRVSNNAWKPRAVAPLSLPVEKPGDVEDPMTLISHMSKRPTRVRVVIVNIMLFTH